MIVFSSLQIRRGVRVLLDNATATINPGQKVGLVGKNGCGKSTLLALLKNEISADGGSCTTPTNVTTGTPLRPFIASWMLLTHGVFAPVPPACCTASVSAMNNWSAR